MTEVEQQVLLALASGGAGGLAGKFLEYSCDAGKRFLGGYFRDHGEAITKAGEDNFTKYLTELIREVRKLESDQKIFEERFNDTLGQPSFAVLLQKSVIGSAKTGSREKHKILAKLVAERLLHDEESILSLNAENWVEKVLRLNKWHFLILKFIDIIYSLSNKEFLQTPFIEKNKIYTDKGCLNDIYDEIKKKINENNKPTAELALLIANLEGNDCLVYRPRRGRENLEKSILNQDIKNNIGISEEKAQLFLNSDEYRDLNSFYLQASMDQFAPTLFGVMLFQYFDGSFNPPSDIYSQTSAS